jgi:hypothetical protein
VEGHIRSDAHTLITLTLPTRLPEGVFQIGEWEIRTIHLSDPFGDPNFNFVHRRPIVLNGMPLAILSPTLRQTEDITPKIEGVTLVEISINQPFHPDLEVDENGTPSTDRTDDFKQLYGDDFDPYLAKVVELLIKSWPSRKAILSALKLADSYAVLFESPDGLQSYYFFQPLVKLSTFLTARDRFLNRFKKAVDSGHSSERLRKLILSEQPLDAEGLQRFVKAVFFELIVKPSSHGDWWKTVWAEGSDYGKVRLETHVARDIFNVVSWLFTVRSLILDKEVAASGGSIDFLATSASGSKMHRCGIELKYAHHDNVLNGISHQLPDYMDDLEAEVGIFLLLWCKRDNYAKPAKYGEISELVSELRKSTPIDKNIDVIDVNASCRPPPSKRRLGSEY